MTKRLNIFELHRTINEKNMRKTECYEKVLETCHRKISIAAEHRQLRLMYEVPEYVVGYPIFDISNCIKFLSKSLKSNGFLVKYYFPKVLYISWDFDEIKTNEESEKKAMFLSQNMQQKPLIQHQGQHVVPNKTKTQKVPQLTSSLIAPKASASLSMKPTGKLALNIF